MKVPPLNMKVLNYEVHNFGYIPRILNLSHGNNLRACEVMDKGGDDGREHLWAYKNACHPLWWSYLLWSNIVFLHLEVDANGTT